MAPSKRQREVEVPAEVADDPEVQEAEEEYEEEAPDVDELNREQEQAAKAATESHNKRVGKKPRVEIDDSLEREPVTRVKLRRYDNRIIRHRWDGAIKGMPTVAHPYIIMYGARRRGKTITARYVLSDFYRKFQFAVICSESAEDGEWDGIVPAEYVHERLTNEIAQTCIARMKRLRTEWKAGGCKGDEPSMLFIGDDIMGSSKNEARSSEAMTAMATLGRHKGITVLLMLQDHVGVLPVVRKNVDYVYIFNQSGDASTEELARLYRKGLDKKEFKNLIDNNTEGHQFVFVDMAALTNKPENVYSVGMAGPYRPYSIFKLQPARSSFWKWEEDE